MTIAPYSDATTVILAWLAKPQTHGIPRQISLFRVDDALVCRVAACDANGQRKSSLTAIDESAAILPQIAEAAKAYVNEHERDAG